MSILRFSPPFHYVVTQSGCAALSASNSACNAASCSALQPLPDADWAAVSCDFSDISSTRAIFSVIDDMTPLYSNAFRASPYLIHIFLLFSSTLYFSCIACNFEYQQLRTDAEKFEVMNLRLMSLADNQCTTYVKIENIMGSALLTYLFLQFVSLIRSTLALCRICPSFSNSSSPDRSSGSLYFRLFGVLLLPPPPISCNCRILSTFTSMPRTIRSVEDVLIWTSCNIPLPESFR